eukprot:scaffold282712_cov16-Prasinocladus_malaysianus.AAC.1
MSGLVMAAGQSSAARLCFCSGAAHTVMIQADLALDMHEVTSVDIYLPVAKSEMLEQCFIAKAGRTGETNVLRGQAELIYLPKIP